MKYIAILSLSIIFWTDSICAETMKSATSVWYFLQLSSNSCEENESLSVEYKFYHKYEVDDIGPIPTLNIVLRNKTTKNIYISLAHSKILRNGRENSIHQGAIAIPPHGQKELSGISIFQPGMEALFGNIFYFKDGFCLSNRIDLNCEEIKQFVEYNTPFTLGGSIVYSVYNDFSEAYELRSIYFVNKVIGSKWNKFYPSSKTDYKSMNKIYPNWNDPHEKYIRLWIL